MARAALLALGFSRESQTALASRGVIDLIAFITNIPCASRCDTLSSLRSREEDICAENNADFLHYEVVPLPHADRPDF
jgi:hypothetical protein